MKEGMKETKLTFRAVVQVITIWLIGLGAMFLSAVVFGIVSGDTTIHFRCF